jgi:CubicO group peptidase (beta-lactamase class C family)
VSVETWTEALDQLLAPLNRSDAPGAVVGVAKAGQVIYRKGFGLANVEHGVANAPRTRMRIGSTTKHFTCLAALLLAEQGKIDADAGIRTYVPELPALSGDPTLRQLMNHAGGYRCYIDLGFIADGEAIHPAPEALALQVRQTCANFPPGERTIYNNGGYNLLSVAMERVSGKPFRALLDELIFQPLGMPDTRLVESDLEVVPGLAGLYVKRGDGWRKGVFITEALRGEGGMISTVDDMLRWLAHLRGAKTVGSAETWRQMTTPAVLNNGFVSPYCLGLIVDSYRGVPVIHHGGSVTGGQCQMITAPEQGLDIIIITNGGWMGAAPTNPDALGYQMIDAILGDEVLTPKPPPPATETYKGLLGAYHCAETGMVLRLEDMEGKLGFNILAGLPMVLDETDEGLVSPFVKTVVGHFVIPADKGDALAQELVISDSGNPDRFRRLPDTGPAAAEVGPAFDGATFYAPDVDATASFRLEGEALELHVQGPYGRSVWLLTPFTQDVLGFSYKGRIPWTGVINVEREGGRVSAFSMTSRRTRNLRFARR